MNAIVIDEHTTPMAQGNSTNRAEGCLKQMRDRGYIIVILSVVLALALGAIHLLTLGHVVEFWGFFANWIVATGTLSLAFSTQAMAEATRRSVEETQKERRLRVEACFRAALLELKENLHHLRSWDPRFGSLPESGWLSRGLLLERFREALSAEWISAGLKNPNDSGAQSKRLTGAAHPGCCKQKGGCPKKHGVSLFCSR